jgi:hypothetical protein
MTRLPYITPVTEIVPVNFEAGLCQQIIQTSPGRYDDYGDYFWYSTYYDE